MNPWRRSTLFVLLAATTVVLAQNHDLLHPSPGPPASETGGTSSVKPTILQGTAIRGSEALQYNPFAANATMAMGDARRDKLSLYFAAQFQKKNAADTNRLVSLARELNATSEKAGNILTAAEIKKAGEIEKLAKRVRERLTTPQSLP